VSFEKKGEQGYQTYKGTNTHKKIQIDMEMGCNVTHW
jgi:hypothetical protein